MPLCSKTQAFTLPSIFKLSETGVMDEMNADKAAYSVEEVAKLLGTGRGQTYQAVRDGSIPCIRIGRRVIIPKAAFHRWLETAGSGEAA